MSRIPFFASIALALALLAPAAPAGAAKPPASWDGLALVDSKKLDAVYLLPGADFRGYTKVMLDPVEVAFQKNWLRDYNSDRRALGQRISEDEAQKMLELARSGFDDIFRKAYEEAGYQIATQPGPDVMRLRTAVVNLTVTAPDQMTPARSRTYAREAGTATIIVEVRDTQTGALLGRAVDGRTVGDDGAFIRNRVTNRADFEQLFRTWAKISVGGLAELKARSPIPESSQ